MVKQELVVSVGELLIDFFCKDIGVSLEEGNHFEKQAGGAPANVCAAISRLGGDAAFIGKVGDDPFGSFLKRTLHEQNVNTDMLLLTNEASTTMAFVSLKENGERDFTFYRGADKFLQLDDINLEKFSYGKVIHFGSATALLEEPFRSTYLQLLDITRKNNQFISFDPNFRHALWGARESDFIEDARHCIGKSDFVKVSEEELHIITGDDRKEQAVDFLHGLGAKIIAVTLGKEGTYVSNGKNKQLIPSISVRSIDSTGAGDAFVGSFLYQVSKLQDPQTLLNGMRKINELISFSNIVGALVCTKIGAIAALPTMDEVRAHLK